MELYPNHLLGYRRWQIDAPSMKLLSTGRGVYTWHPGVNKARCNFFLEHDPPDKECECGFYALYKSGRSPFWGGCVEGAVRASGGVQLHYDGFRAQNIEVIALLMDGHAKRLLGAHAYEIFQNLGRQYQVPIFSSRKQMRKYVLGLGEEIEPQMIEDLPKPDYWALEGSARFIESHFVEIFWAGIAAWVCAGVWKIKQYQSKKSKQ